jgi:hypothetical protein
MGKAPPVPQNQSARDDSTTATPLFTRIQIQTVSWCNRSCAFCPSGTFPVPKTFMPVDVYHRIIGQLHDLRFTGRISPYLMNESLLDKRLPELIAYAREWCPDSWIAINTNGDALSERLIDRLFDAGLNCMDVNAYDNRSQYERYVALAERVAARRSDLACSTGYNDPTFNRFQARQATPDLTNRSGNVPHARLLRAPLALGCERPFQQMYINYRGEAVLCCNDWRFEVVMGDTATATLLDIWSNAAYQAYRRNLQRQDRNMRLCATCDYKADPASWD